MKMESTFKNMLIVLTCVCLISGISLGGVYVLTKDTIDKAKKEKQVSAIKGVLPAFETMEEVNTDDSGTIVFKAFNGNDLVGIAIETYSNNGFGGIVKIIAGFLPDGTINKIVVLEHKETPGLGDKMATGWNAQFENKNPENFKLKVKKDGGDVDAITAATISSRAFCDATQRAYDAFMSNK